MRFHPEIVERAVLHGMEGPDHTWDHPGWFWNVYKRVAADAESGERLKPHIPDGGLIGAAEMLVQQAQKQPITVILNEGESGERKVVIDGHAMQRLVRGFSGGLPSWPADIIAMPNGDFEKAARSLLFRATFRKRDFSTASYWMLDSGSGISQERLAEFEADPARNKKGSMNEQRTDNIICLVTPNSDYSCRNASIGSICAARMAG